MRNLVCNCSLGEGRSCWGGACVGLHPGKEKTPGLLPLPPVTPPSLLLCQWQEAGLDSGATWPAHSWGGGGTLCPMTTRDFPSAANAHPRTLLSCASGLVPCRISHIKPRTCGSASLWYIMGPFPRSETSPFFSQDHSAPYLASLPL